MHWVVQNNMFSEEGFSKLLDALERLDVPYSLVKVVPFSHELVWIKEHRKDWPDRERERTVVMGTNALCGIAHERGWKPGSFDNLNFDYWVQSEMWPDEMLNAHAWHGWLQDIPKLWDEPFFIRPVHDTKSFVGGVMDWPSFETWRFGVMKLRPEDGATVTPYTEVMVAPKKKIWSETRVWVVDGKAVTASLYKRGTIKRYSADVPSPILAYAEGLCQKWVPSRAFVMDVADTPEGLKVVEVNNLNSAGFYAGDMQKLVAAIEAMEW